MENSYEKAKTQSVANSLNEKTIQNKAIALQDNRPASLLQRKVNNTGLPENLKSGIENLSGHSMDNVKVHYNSSKPAQLQAHAYAQGTDIHIASGQEKHLPHEAWHVVQQKQGRVKPTLQMKGKVNVNDDKDLENEADIMGAKAFNSQVKSKESQSNFSTSNVIQNKSVFQLGKRDKKKKLNEIKKETHGRRKRFKQQFIASTSPKELKSELRKKYEGDDLALANIENAWKDTLKNFYPVVGLNVIIVDPVLKLSFEEAMKTIKFQKLVEDVLLEQKRIKINLDQTRTKWLTNKKTIIIKQENNATKESYLRSLIFEMSNAYNTKEFNEHNKKMKEITKSKNNKKRQNIRFGFNPKEMADAVEETEWKSVAIARSIGNEGIEKHNWNDGMVNYYSPDKDTHMRIQKDPNNGEKGVSHYQRYINETKKIQTNIRKKIELTYTPKALRKRFFNDTLLKNSLLGKNISEENLKEAVQFAISTNSLTDKTVMDYLKRLYANL